MQKNIRNLLIKMTINKKLTSISNYFNLGTALLLCVSQLLYFPYQYIPLILFFVSYVVDFLLERRYKSLNLNPGKEKWLFIACIIYFSLIPIYHLFEHGNTFFLKSIETYMPFAAFGIIGFLGFNSKYKIRYFCYCIILVALTSVCFISYKTGNFSFFDSSFGAEFIITRTLLINNHMIYNIYLNLAVVAILYLIFLPQKATPLIYKIILSISFLIILFALVISEGRTGQLTFLIITFFIFSYKTRTWKKKFLIPVYILITVPVIIIFSYNVRLDKNFIRQDPRIQIWDAALKTTCQKPIWGHGSSDGFEIFQEIGKSNERTNMTYDWPPKAHPHNQFLWSWMCFGIFGLLLFSFILIYPVIICKKERIYICSICLIFTIQALFECFGAGIPIILFTFVFALLFAPKSNTPQRSDL